MVSVLKVNILCMNCLRPGHFFKQCKFPNRCKKCQEIQSHFVTCGWLSHYTSLVWFQSQTHHIYCGCRIDIQFLTCHVLADAPDGSSVQKWFCLLSLICVIGFDSKHTCFESNPMYVPHSHQSAKISGVAGLFHNSPIQSITNLSISAVRSNHQSRRFKVTAVVVPRPMCDLPLHTCSLQLEMRSLIRHPTSWSRLWMPW